MRTVLENLVLRYREWQQRRAIARGERSTDLVAWFQELGVR